MPSAVPPGSPDAGLHAYLRQLATPLDAILRSAVREFETEQIAWDKTVESVYTAARERVEKSAPASSSGDVNPKSLDSSELSRSLVLETTCPGPNPTDRAVDFLLLEVEGFLSSSAPFKRPTAGEEALLAADRIGGVGTRSREDRLKYAARSAVLGSLPISSLRDIAGIVADSGSRLDDSAADGDPGANARGGQHWFDFPTIRRGDEEQASLLRPPRSMDDPDAAWEAHEEKQPVQAHEVTSVHRTLAPLECKLLNSHLARSAPSAASPAALLWRTYLCSWFGSSVQDRMSSEGYLSYRVSLASSVGLTPGFLGELGVSQDSVRDAFFVFARYAQLRLTNSIGADSSDDKKTTAQNKEPVVHPSPGPASPSALGGSSRERSTPAGLPSTDPRAWSVAHLSLSRWLSKSQLELFLRCIHLSESARSTLVQFFFERTDQTSNLCSYARFLRRWLLLDHLTRVVLRNNADPSVRAGLGNSVAPSREASMVRAELAHHGHASHRASAGPSKPTLSPQNVALLQAFAHLSRQLRQSTETALEADQMDDSAAASVLSSDVHLSGSSSIPPAPLPTHVYVLTRLEKAFFWFWGTLVLSAGWLSRSNSDEILLSWQLCRLRSWLWSWPWMIKHGRLSASLEQEVRRVHDPQFRWFLVLWFACGYSCSYWLPFILMSAQAMQYGQDTYQLIPSRVPFFFPGILMFLISLWASYACLTEPDLPPKRILHAVVVDCRSGEADHPIRRVSNMEQLIMHMELDDAARTFKQAMYQRWDHWHKWSRAPSEPTSKAAALAAKLRGQHAVVLEPLVMSVAPYVHVGGSSEPVSAVGVRADLHRASGSSSPSLMIMLFVTLLTELAVFAWCIFVSLRMSQMNALSSTPSPRRIYDPDIFDRSTRDALPQGFLCPSTTWSFSANSTEFRSQLDAAAASWHPAMSPCAKFCQATVVQWIGGGTGVIAECTLTGSMMVSIAMSLWWVIIVCALCGVIAPITLYYRSQQSLLILQRFTALVSRARSPALFLPLRSMLNIQAWLLLRDDQKHMLRVVSRDTSILLNPVVLTVVCCLLVVIIANLFKADAVMSYFVAPVCVVLSVSVGVVVWALFKINGEFDRGADVLHGAIWQTNTEKAQTMERAHDSKPSTTVQPFQSDAAGAKPAQHIAIEMAPSKLGTQGPASMVPESSHALSLLSGDVDPSVPHARVIAALDSRKELLEAAREHVLFEQGKVGFTVFGVVVTAGVIQSLGLQALVAGVVALVKVLFK